LFPRTRVAKVRNRTNAWHPCHASLPALISQVVLKRNSAGTSALGLQVPGGAYGRLAGREQERAERLRRGW